MKNAKPHIIGLLVALLAVLGSGCRQVTLEVKDVPANTPRGAQIYVAGNFNNWNPGDPNYVLRYDEEDSVYRVTLPLGVGRLMYKFTRGDWTTVETDLCGEDITDRAILYDATKTVTVGRIQSWHDMEPVDCGRVTVVLKGLPQNTPKTDSIFLTGPFNNWLNKRSDFRFRRDSLGRYVYTFNKRGKEKEIEFKINRGSWEKVEVDKYGIEMPMRKLVFGVDDTLYYQVENWSDLIRGEIAHSKVIIIDKLPPYTPKEAELYFAGSINDWNPYDKKLRFNKSSNGKYWYLILPPSPPNSKTWGKVDFKITRGGWETEEVDDNFKIIDDRSFYTDKRDTIVVRVQNWIDHARFRKKHNVVIILDKVPANTPEKIYLTGTFNDWDERDRNFRFKKNENGKWYTVVKDVHADFEYKITLGDWETEAVNEFFMRPSNSVYRVGSPDTVHVTIKNWMSLPYK